MPIKDFKKHDSRGFDVPEAIPFEEYSKRFPLTLCIETVSWRDENNSLYQIDARDLLIEVLPDRSGLICIENPLGKHKRFKYPAGAFVINKDGSQRYKLAVPLELVSRSENPSDIHRFCWIEKNSSYGLTAIVDGFSEFYFELDHHTGKFLWGEERRF